MCGLGLGEFFTQGYAEGISGGWQLKDAMKIEGSGMGVTTLKLVNVKCSSARRSHRFKASVR